MRPFNSSLITVLLLIAFEQTLTAQTTYPITASLSTSAFPAFNSCTNCIFDLSPGVVLTVNSNVSCSTCTFNGGTVIFSSGTVTMNGTNSFNNDTVLINEALSVGSMNFSGDSVAENSSLSVTSGGTTITNTALAVNASLNFISVTMTGDRIHAKVGIYTNASTLTNTSLALTANGTFNTTGSTVTGSTISMSGTSTGFYSSGSLTIGSTDITMNSASAMTSSGAMSITGGSVTSAGKISTGSSITLAGDTVTMTGGYMAGSSITATTNGATGNIISMSGTAHDSTGGTLSMSHTTLTMSNSAYMKSSSTTFSSGTLTMNNEAVLEPTNGLTFTASTVQMNDTTTITAGSLTIQTGSFVTIGGGETTSAASISLVNGLKVLDTSNLALNDHNNFFTSGSSSFTGGTTSYSIASNTVSCGGAGEHACVADYVFGCATMNKNGAVGCVTLAISGITLTATIGNAGSVDLTWTDAQTSTAENYRVQRSNGNDTWTTITEVAADAFTPDNYQYQDHSAPAGTADYRIARTAKDGSTTYSAISTVTINTPRTTVAIFPNPASGHTFNLTVPGTEQLLLNVYTLTGQLVLRTSLQGQTQYAVQLPSQLMPGTTLVVQAILRNQAASFPLLLR